MFILLLVFLGSYDWYPVQGGEVSREILESPIVKRFGENRLRKSFIKLDAEVFEGGCMALLPKGYRIQEVPKGLKMVENDIEMEKFDRYSAIYESGKLKKEWEELKSGLMSAVGFGKASFKTPSLGELHKFVALADKEAKEIEYPGEVYYSFLLVEREWEQKLVPVLLVLSPLDEIAKEIRKEKSEVRGGEQ